MAKFYGVIGFVQQEETSPGIWEDVCTEKPYYGELLKNLARHQSANQLNDNFVVSDEISIIADGYLRENLAFIKYVNYMGINWKVTNLDGTNYPRIVLTLGGIYNGKDQTRSS